MSKRLKEYLRRPSNPFEKMIPQTERKSWSLDASFTKDLDARLLAARRAVEARARSAAPRRAGELFMRFEATLANLDAAVVSALAAGLVTKGEAKAVLLATARASRFIRRG